MITKSVLTLFLSAAIFSGCTYHTINEKNETPVNQNVTLRSATPEDGIYLVLQTWDDSTAVLPESSDVVAYSRDLFDESTGSQPFFIELDTRTYVPLALSEKPEGIEQADKRINLLLTLSEDAGNSLQQFTRDNLNRHICIVIGGQAVTMHKIKEEITGGKLQVTRCTDNACEKLLIALQDNVIKD